MAKENLQSAGWGLRKGPSGMIVMPSVTQKNKAAMKPRLPL